MTDPKFGVIYSRLHPVVPIPVFAEAVEEMDFDSLWVTEGLVNEMPALDIMLALGAFVQHTRKLTVGTCVVLLPLRNPALMAKEVATLDFLSEGRVVLGVGVGGSNNSEPAAFEVCGVDVKERGPRTDEALEIMTKLWTGEPVSHKGRFYQFKDITMGPRPVQRPHPPLWAGGAARGVLRRTARWCDGFVPNSVGAEGYRLLWDGIERFGEEYGRDTSGITRAIHMYFCISETRERARGIARETLTKRYGREVELPDDTSMAIGMARDCIETIESYMKAGVSHFILNTARPLAEVKGDIEKFAEEVMPHFR